MPMRNSPTTNYQRLFAAPAGSADVTEASNVYKFVKLDANGRVVLADAGDEVITGILINPAKTFDANSQGFADDQACGVLREYGARVILQVDPTSGDLAGGTTLAVGADGTATESGGSVWHAQVVGESLTAAESAAAPVKMVEAVYMPGSPPNA